MSPAESRSDWLDFLRAGCALLVYLGHARSAFFADFSQLPEASVSWQMFYFVTSLGHESVLIFFVLSGYFVGGSLLRTRAFDMPKYWLARLTRLWVVLLPALLITALADTFTAEIHPVLLISQAAWNSLPSEGAYASGPGVLLGNAIFLQTLVVPVYGSNGPMWSLAYEFWYYVLFPVFLLPFRGSSPILLVLRLAIASIFLTFASTEFLAGFIVWMFGAGVRVMQNRIQRRGIPLLVLSAIAAALVVLAAKLLAALGWPRPVLDIILGVPFATGIAALGTLRTSFRGSLALVCQRLAQISFSLYATHFPLLVLTMALLHIQQKLVPGPLPLAHMILAMLAMLAFAAIFWLAFERHTELVRRTLASVRVRVSGIHQRRIE